MNLYKVFNLLILLSNNHQQRNELAVKNIKLVDFIVYKYFNHLPRDIKEDIKHESYFGYLKACDRYCNEEFKIKFSTLASRYIRTYATNAIKKNKKIKKEILSSFDQAYVPHDNLKVNDRNVNMMKNIHEENVCKRFYDYVDNNCNEKRKIILYKYFRNNESPKSISKELNISLPNVYYSIKTEMKKYKIYLKINEYN